MSASGNVHLIAAPIPLPKRIYAPNGGTGTMNPTAGGVGTTVRISVNLFTYPSSKFTGWNTMADGTGDVYEPGDPYTLTAEDLTLYAQWITPVNVIIIWDDANDMDGIRPKEGLSVSLAQGGHVLNISGGATDATYLLTPAESWMHTFELPAGDYSHIELWEGSADGYTKSQESKLFNENDITIVVINKHTLVPAATVTNYKVPKTGDPVNVPLLWLLVLISFAGLLAVGTFRRRKRKG